MTARQRRARELEYRGDQDRGPDGDRARADGGPHGVGDIVGADAPCHEQAENNGDRDENRTVLSDDFHGSGSPDPTAWKGKSDH